MCRHSSNEWGVTFLQRSVEPITPVSCLTDWQRACLWSAFVPINVSVLKNLCVFIYFCMCRCFFFPYLYLCVCVWMRERERERGRVREKKRGLYICKYVYMYVCMYAYVRVRVFFPLLEACWAIQTESVLNTPTNIHQMQWRLLFRDSTEVCVCARTVGHSYFCASAQLCACARVFFCLSLRLFTFARVRVRLLYRSTLVTKYCLFLLSKRRKSVGDSGSTRRVT